MTGHIEGISSVEEISTPAALVANILAPQVDMLEVVAEGVTRYRNRLSALGWPEMIIDALSCKILADLNEKMMK